MSNRPVSFPADNSARIPADVQPQDGPAGTRYLSPGSQSFDVSCGPACGAVTLNFQTQYSLTVTSEDGGVVSPAGPRQNAGAAVTLTATPNAGYSFAGWEGDCTGQVSCQLVMNGPKAVKADFVATSAHQRPF